MLINDTNLIKITSDTGEKILTKKNLTILFWSNSIKLENLRQMYNT